MIDFLVLGLAINQICEVWRHSRMPLIVELRAWAQRTPGSVAWWYAECPWCFSVVVGLILTTGYFLPPSHGPWVDGLWVVGIPVRWFAWAMAASRLANWINDFNYEIWRTPERKYHETQGTEETEAYATGSGVYIDITEVPPDRPQ